MSLRWRVPGPPPIHTLLFAAWPVLFLVAHNRDVTSPREAVTPLLVIVGVVAAVLLVAGRLTRATRKVAVGLSVSVVLFFSYGHVWTFVHNDLVLASAFGAVAAATLVGLVRTRRPLRDLTRVLNIVAAVMAAVLLVSIVTDGARRPARASSLGLSLDEPAAPRDIYYLIFDRYADATVLRDHFGFDNGPFIRSLEDRGFVVAQRSTANYQNTHMSLASSLNMDHLDRLMADVGRPSMDLEPVFERIRRSEVARLLKGAGYRYVHVGSWASFTASSPIADVNLPPIGGSEFSRVLYGSTALSPMLRTAATNENVTQRDATLGAFSKLDEAIGIHGPKFVFAHFIIPHPPYVFDRDGDVDLDPQREGNVRGYLEQVRFANAHIERIVARLLDVPPDERPIIVIQSDEGPYPRLSTRFPPSWATEPAGDVRVKYGILNAYLLPGASDSPGAVYPTISPVNTFRVIFDRYFGTDLGLLPDESFSTASKKDRYTLVGLGDAPAAAPSRFRPPPTGVGAR